MRAKSGERVLRLRPEHLQAMRRAVERAAPEEGCGLVLGARDRATEVVPIENALHSPNRFRLEGSAQVRALMRGESAGWQLVAVFHSHPAGPAQPSATDLAEAAYPEAFYLIWAPGATEAWECRAYVLEGDDRSRQEGGFVPALLRVEE